AGPGSAFVSSLLTRLEALMISTVATRFMGLVLGLCLCSGLFTAEVMAQTATVTGTVTDASDGLPLGGANVLLTSDGSTLISGAATDPDGNYRIADIAPGSYVLVARFVGYQEIAEQVTLAAGQELE